jgi:hypothetical protein
MVAFLNLDAADTTMLLYFGWLVLMPLCVGIVALAKDLGSNHRNRPV